MGVQATKSHVLKMLITFSCPRSLNTIISLDWGRPLLQSAVRLLLFPLHFVSGLIRTALGSATASADIPAPLH